MPLIAGKQIATGVNGIADANIVPGTISSASIITSGATGIADLADAQTFSGAKTFSATTTFTGDVIVPTSPAGATSAVNKNYVDSVATGITWKHPSRLATTAALGANTYANGTSGLGATLTSTSGSFAALGSIDGVSPTIGDRILVKNEAAPAHNGIYTFTTNGNGTSVNWVLTRATDFDQNPNGGGFNEVVAGAATFIEEGTAYANTAFVQTDVNPIVMGTDSITFVQFSGAGAYSFNNGLTQTGTIINVNPGDNSLVATPGSLTVKRDGAGAIGISGAGIAVNVDGTSIDINTNALEIATNGVTTAKIAAANVTLAKLASDSVDENKIVSTALSATGALAGGSGTKLSVKVDAATVVINGSDQLAVGTITNSNIVNGTISGTKLTNNSVTATQVNTTIAQTGNSNTFTGTLNDFTGTEITASTPVNATDVANKSYVDSAITGSVIAGAGMTSSTTATSITLNVIAGDASVLVNANELHVQEDPAGAISTTGSGVAVNVDGTSIDISANAVEIKALGVTTAKLANANVTLAKMANNAVDENIIVSTAVTNGLTGGSGSKLAVLPNGTSVSVSGSGLKAAVPTTADKSRFSVNNTSGNDSDTGLTITSAPAGSSDVIVMVNGLQYKVGNGSNTGCDCYFGATSGTAHTFATIVAGDKLFWNGTIAGFQLATTDLVDLNYVVII